MDVKTKSLLTRIADIASAVILVIVILLTISIISSAGKGYTSVFGTAYALVQSDSMDGEYGQKNGEYSDSWEYEKNGFKKGEVLAIRVLSDEEKQNLKVGDIITFKAVRDGQNILNTHRIRRIENSGSNIVFYTHGDNALGGEATPIANVVGIYEGGKSAFVGGILTWFSSTGGMIFITVLVVLILAYCIFTLTKYLNERNKSKMDEKVKQFEQEKQEEIEKLRRQIMEEMGQNPASATEAEQTPTDNTEGQKTDG